MPFTEDSRLWTIPSAALVGTQLPTDTETQLDLAKLPHEALQGLHNVVFQEIRHRDQRVHQQLGTAEHTITQQDVDFLLSMSQQVELKTMIH